MNTSISVVLASTVWPAAHLPPAWGHLEMSGDIFWLPLLGWGCCRHLLGKCSITDSALWQPLPLSPTKNYLPSKAKGAEAEKLICRVFFSAPASSGCGSWSVTPTRKSPFTASWDKINDALAEVPQHLQSTDGWCLVGTQARYQALHSCLCALLLPSQQGLMPRAGWLLPIVHCSEFHHVDREKVFSFLFL
jgi:hypothetical protein